MSAWALRQDQDDRELVGEELRRTILRALADIHATLDMPDPTPREIHLARRAAKRVRALARLAPPPLSVLARQTIKGAGDARRGFGGARDAGVRLATLDELRSGLPDQAHQRLRLLAEKDDASSFAADRSTARATIAALVRDWTLCDADAGAGEIADAATKTYRRARRRMKRASSGGSDDLHRWRSVVVDHEYYADFLAGFASDMRRQSDDADRLRKYLGDLHDLDALAEYFHGRKGDDDERADIERLETAIAPQRAMLADKAMRLGKKLYADRPKKWRRTLMKSVAPDNGSQTPEP